MHGKAPVADQEVNLGIFDGEVEHREVNAALASAPKVVLFGEQTRLPYFPEDARLPKLYAGDPLVLLFWKVMKKIPRRLRNAILDGGISLTLTRGESLLYFRDFRCHQALHIGRRRRTIYLPERLLLEAEEKGYDYWAVAEGVIYAAWILLDYLLLVEVLKAYGQEAPGRRLGLSLVRRLVEKHNLHRREHAESRHSEVHEFIEAYRGRLMRIAAAEARGFDPFELAHRVFEADGEKKWARDKMERIAEVFNFPRLFLFDRDIIHGAARDLALKRGQEIAPRSFAEVLHDYRDALRFDPDPLMTGFCKGVAPKPRVTFLRRVVERGGAGLRGFFAAYREGVPEVVDLMHPLWIYLCSLSSDPAGVFSRVGRCRALGHQGLEEGLDQALAGLLIRLDKAPDYEVLVGQVASMGAAARAELEALIAAQRLCEEDEWAPFKIRKQTIVMRAGDALARLEGGEAQVSHPAPAALVHEDERIVRLLADHPHRRTSDPSGMLMYLRAYQRSLEEFGAGDPDSHFLLASLLIRLDRAENYEALLGLLPRLGVPAVAALYSVLEQISERDERRGPILEQARLILARLLLRRREMGRKKGD